MYPRFWERWLRGFGLTILAAIIYGIAWGIPRGIGEVITQSEAISEWLRTVLLVVWLLLMLLFSPIVFEWLARQTGLAPERRGNVIRFPELQGNRGNEGGA